MRNSGLGGWVGNEVEGRGEGLVVVVVVVMMVVVVVVMRL